MDYTIFSFDMRGQGFSSSTGYDKGVVTHVNSFSEYVNDLDTFLTNQVTPKVKALIGDTTNVCNAKDSSSGSRTVGVEGTSTTPTNHCSASPKFTYVGNSMSSLVALTLQSQKPETFDKMVCITPLILPLGVNIGTRLVVYAAYMFGFGSKLLIRLPRDISDIKNTHSLEK